MDKKKILVSCAGVILIMTLLLTGKLADIFSFLGYYGVNYIPAYRYNGFLMTGIASIFFIMGYLAYEIWQITWNKLKKRENITLENFVKYLLAAYIFFIAVPQSRKYGLRVTGYIITPYILYYLIKNRKKIRYDINDIFLGGFWISIALSMKNSLDRKNVMDEFQDGTFIFFMPLIMKQFNFGDIFQKLMIRFSLLAFSIKIMLGYMEKINVIYGIHGHSRIGGGDEVWRYAGIIMIGIVFFIYLAVNKKQVRPEMRIPLYYGLYLSLVPMLWSQNRANWVAIAAVTAFMLMARNFKRGIIIASLALALILGAVYSGKINHPFIKRVETIVKFKKDGSVQSRFEIWRESISMFKKFPITGVGYSYKSFEQREEVDKYKMRNFPYGHSHNIYLYILATMGGIGFLFFMGFNISLLYSLLKANTYLTNLGAVILMSWQVMGFFETPIKYLDMMGPIFFIIGYAQNKYYQEKKDGR